MDPKGDITDAFDDDGDLRDSIEAADRGGQWRDKTASFVDAKYEALRKELSTPLRETYTERRMRELQEKTAAALAAPAPPPPKPAEPPASDWRDTVVRREPPAPEPPAPPPEAAAAAPRFHLAEPLAAAGAAAVVFVPIALLHGALAGWQWDLALRTAAASVIAGVGWWSVGAGRFRSAGIGAVAHVLTFFAGADLEDGGRLLASFLGLLLAILGSSVAGLVREQHHARH